ncbi:MAG: helix-turn-helix domain-containing protein [Gammaproteobacteria bacterium]|nr:helix-turn-helix domain-containing protein [Gammaproteobacteria bacterium]
MDEQTVYRWLWAGKLIGYKVGDKWHIKAGDLPGNNHKDSD